MSKLADLKKQYQCYLNEGLSLDMTRGKPSPEQLDLSQALMTVLNNDEFLSEDGVDCRNYSPPTLLSGLPEAKRLFAHALEIDHKQPIVIGGNASLAMMYDTISWAMLHALPGSNQSWSQQGKIKFIAPVPGYDRHFNICRSLGIEMINVPLTGHGPDMDQVEALVKSDPSIKGIWCVPKYSNPTGETYSHQTVSRLANMDTQADDFRMFWDNAYAVHHLHGKSDELADIFALAPEEKKDRIFMYASTSKVTYAGGGIAAVVTSDNNYQWFIERMKYKTIGFDKINQLRHVKFFKKVRSLTEHMKKHSDILSPKFDKVDQVLTDKLGSDQQYAEWTKPNGGYFISFNTKPHLASKVVDLAGKAGVKLTQAGATFPYGKDPEDKNIRIAPSLPSLAEIEKATEILATVTKMVTLEA